MKKLILIFLVLVFTSCSLDNKTGIWKDISDIPVEKQASKSISSNSKDKIYEDISQKNQIFNEEIETVNFSNIEIDKPVKISNWPEQYAISTNNISNFYYNGNKILIKKTKLTSRLSSKNSFNKKIIFYKNNLITHDHKGTVFIFSLKLNKKIFEYNFYKKNFKKFNKEVSFIVNDNVLYAADNLGYIYAFNLDNYSMIWAKNYGIPFRSNLKFAENQIFLANQDNVIYSINANTGEKKWQFATSLTELKSDFENSFALDIINNNLFFLNTSGELYSINFITQKINWVLNFKNPSLGENTELFLSHPLVVKNDNLIVTTQKAILSYNTLTASKNWSLFAEPVFKPVLTPKNTYAILRQDLLICLDNASGKVIWSQDIFKDIKEKNIKKIGKFADFKIVNGELNIYSKSGYILSFDRSDGNLNFFSRINKKGINSEIFFLDDNMFFVDSKDKLLKFN
jgi:outer membrane protein assembly factor BamB